MRQAADRAVARPRGRRIIERPRLIKLLDETAARTILLIAPAGYGKTTLARQWAERQPGVHWYTARTGSADVAQLAVDLAGVLDTQAPKLKNFVSELVRARSSPAQQVAEIAEGFAGSAGDLGDVSLFIDDYHILADNEVAEWFVRELQLRMSFRLVIASRYRPRWATARLALYGETIELTTDELALTDAEALEVLGASSSSPSLVGQARGWPAVVGLAAQTSSGSPPPEGEASTLFRYFAEELFRATPASLQEKLVTLALLPSLSRSLTDAALRGNSQEVIDQAVASGLASNAPECPEFHPLVREYLYSKLRDDDDVLSRIQAAVEVSLDGEYWDHAFHLVERFAATALLDPLARRSFRPLLSSGRIATLEIIAQYSRGVPDGSTPIIRLIDAELAFRNGLFEPAASIADGVAVDLASNDRLVSHAWWLAGMGAAMSFDDLKAASYFERAKSTAQDDDDLRDALWGLVMAACQSEQPESTDALEQIRSRRGRSSVDFVRWATAQLHAWRLGLRDWPLDTDRAMHELGRVSDPRIATGFLNQFAYDLVLWGRYDTAHEIAESFRTLIDEYRLTWARPHAEWALAASALGRRQFAAADNWLRKVEQVGEQLRYGQLVLNASCARSRMLLALGRPGDAWAALMVDDTLPANPAMRGEFLGTKALVLAVQGDFDQATSLAAMAREMTTSVEAHAYAACVDSICAQQRGSPYDEVRECIRTAERLQVWDPLIAAFRAWPPLLKEAARGEALPSTVLQALRNSRDFDLARQADVALGRRPSLGRPDSLISPREREVLQLLREGFTNAEIARTLFISQATVKVHVRHILEKTGARSRTEAAAKLLPDD